jgi:hypothetical protein
MKSFDRIDQALDNVLKATGSALKYYTVYKTLEEMRSAMREAMSEAYIQGAHDYAATLETGKIE